MIILYGHLLLLQCKIFVMLEHFFDEVIDPTILGIVKKPTLVKRNKHFTLEIIFHSTYVKNDI